MCELSKYIYMYMYTGLYWISMWRNNEYDYKDFFSFLFYIQNFTVWLGVANKLCAQNPTLCQQGST